MRKPNAIQQNHTESKNEARSEKIVFLLASLPLYLKIIAVRTDHKRVRKNETFCCSVTQTSHNHADLKLLN